MLKVIEYMPLIGGYKKKLESLNEQLIRTILCGKINSIGTAGSIIDFMEGMHEKFFKLQNDLVKNLEKESLKKVILEISSKAQVAIDILIRNLYERTADVGFLATDEDIRQFMANPDPSAKDNDFIIERLNEYVKKYTVYEEIVLLECNGRVKSHLNKENPIHSSEDPLIKETLATSSGYLETFRYSDIQPKKDTSLIYSCKISGSNIDTSPILGVLCLCFKFQNEMEGIFKKLVTGSEGEILLLLNKDDQVIASSDEKKIPVTTKVRKVLDKEYDITVYNRIPYLAKTTKTKGYQGFFGLEWYGHILKPLKTAFKIKTGDIDEGPSLSDSIMKESILFSDDLVAIRTKALDINDDLKDVVINGEIIAAREKADVLNPILRYTRETGESISNTFHDSVNDLQRTVITSLLNDVKFLASLAIDIMDRNLYERSDDCRWWALTSEFRKILAQTGMMPQDREAITTTLQYINRLYTVYSNLFVYDSKETILAVSNQDEKEIVGKRLTDGYIVNTLGNNDSQKYFVSPFQKTDLYAGRPTYVYSASITDLKRKDKTVGGIGIVFDSEPQFRSMLTDALPKDEGGNPLSGCFGVFADGGGTIISSTDPEHAAGNIIELDKKYLSLKNGEGTSEISEYMGKYYAIGCMTSNGYREYKNTGDYVNDVIALVFVRV
jgi:hypothetical protein